MQAVAEWNYIVVWTEPLSTGRHFEAVPSWDSEELPKAMDFHTKLLDFCTFHDSNNAASSKLDLISRLIF